MKNERTGGLLAERTIDYGLMVMELCGRFPPGFAAKHISGQLLRSATSVAANYAEATDAESDDDFVHKMKVALKELKESRVWLRFASRLSNAPNVDVALRESRELVLMLGKSISTVSSRIRT
jgi:four helix bundle protein